MEPIIGLEIHAQLNTRTKMFCWDKNDPFTAEANTHICPICMGHPGTLPVPNQAAIDKVVQAGLAVEGKISRRSKFDRKNYFYPDLPKGYQISQYDIPLVKGGVLYLPQNDTEIRIRRIHLEEDTGRLMHKADRSLVDYNRAGVPLMELVTEPDIKSGAEASEFAKELQLLFRYLNLSQADMEKGQMRVEANISLLQQNHKSQITNHKQNTNLEMGAKVELKNLNSFKAVRDAVAYEIERQTALLEQSEEVQQETRGWNPDKNETFSQRTKETESDYRYFPEPDIPPVQIGSEKLRELERSMPELPAQRRERFQEEYGLELSEVRTLVNHPEMGEYFESAVSEIDSWEKETEGGKGHSRKHSGELIRQLANYLINELSPLVRSDAEWNSLKITPENFAETIWLLHQGKLSSSGVQTVLKELYDRGGEPDHIMRELDLEQVSESSELEVAVQSVIEQNPEAVQDYASGKENALQFLVGQVMAHTKGKANPQKVQEILKRNLSKQ